MHSARTSCATSVDAKPMEPLLFLVHRIPFPPNKGDKVRSYHLLRFLATRYRVHLGTFVDDPNDWAHVDDVRSLCADACFVPLEPRYARIRSLVGIARGEALSLWYYRDARLKAWVERVLTNHTVRAAVAFSAPMAQYVRNCDGLLRVVDMVDVDSEKWVQYA